ncbi:hypothetical protein LZZ90_08300 [Flavobacterium sp. SM15]|uniref:DUF6712 family protein n=1 Tax=Flavobacterium sp. SM15 TaxID=2908005 RepID=UPI001EDB3038|nr:hypothetical protein [Flavobacterium sp. SM15]MCG2611507.1 hypothetical protein [Flavobacterium sp. SM15]
MNKIVTATEIKTYKDVGEKIDEKKINPIIEQAQITELKDRLGSDFFFDVLANLSNPDYQNLLSGSTFTHNGIEYYQDGLKALTADYFMSKYVLLTNVNHTPFGATTKLSNDSQPVDRNTLKDISTQQMQLAGSRWEIIKLYLDSNSDLFPKWGKNNTCGGSTSVSERRFRIRKI